MVEMNNMVLNVLSGRNDVADQAGVVRNFDPERIFDCAHGGQGVHHGADTANPLRPKPGFARVAIADDEFDAAKHRAGTPRIGDLAAVHLGFDPKVAFDASDWIYHYAGH